MQAIAERFEEAGGRFVTPVTQIARRLRQCRAIVFDWDGVFNSGAKGSGVVSGFSEPDSMGTNMLRFGLWCQSGKLPYAAIVSGERNAAAIEFAGREHFSAVQTGVSDKRVAIDALCDRYDLEVHQLACVFDDVNDLSMAAACGLRFMVRRTSSPMLADYVARNSLSDYLTGDGDYPVREVCELALGVMGNYDDVIASRVAYDERYQAYWQARQSVTTATPEPAARSVSIGQSAKGQP